MSNDLTQMINFPTRIADCDSHSPSLLNLFHYSDTSIGSQDFWRITNSVLNKGKSAIPPLFNGQEVLSSATDNAKLFGENVSKNSNLND